MKEVYLLKPSIIVIPVMLLVFFLALARISEQFAVIPFFTRLLIAAGGAALSGIIMYFLMKPDSKKGN